MLKLLFIGSLLSLSWAAQVPCSSLPNKAGPNQEVCASDGNTYPSIQEMECLAMERRKMGLEEIFMRHEGPCATDSRLVKRTSYGRFTAWTGRTNGSGRLVTSVTSVTSPLLLLLLLLLWR
ncbi:uncharacterized protein LOC122367155 [Amphibalanus amphitrite]|uniref:uncharacterized protein LOC122367155 n=1 Tax=Amphibalanus amphitrite TaxID=1232801 RepID=UPI001C91C8E0|nr:uncharacterized protein LOC122367155 [Amphibalanus amphitrite]